MTVADVADMKLHQGMSEEEIAGKYDLPLSSVYEAMAYYFDNQADIDQRTAEDTEFAERVLGRHRSPLEEKLGASSNDRANTVPSG